MEKIIFGILVIHNHSNRYLGHKPIIKKIEKRKVYSSFKDGVWDVDLADMQLISKFNEGSWHLLFVIDIWCKHRWVVLLKDKKGI